MTLATEKISPHILEALHQRGHSADDISKMSPPGAFCEFCERHGFIGWGGFMWDTVDNLKQSEAAK